MASIMESKFCGKSNHRRELSVHGSERSVLRDSRGDSCRDFGAQIYRYNTRTGENSGSEERRTCYKGPVSGLPSTEELRIVGWSAHKGAFDGCGGKQGQWGVRLLPIKNSRSTRDRLGIKTTRDIKLVGLEKRLLENINGGSTYYGMDNIRGFETSVKRQRGIFLGIVCAMLLMVSTCTNSPVSLLSLSLKELTNTYITEV